MRDPLAEEVHELNRQMQVMGVAIIAAIMRYGRIGESLAPADSVDMALDIVKEAVQQCGDPLVGI